MYKLKIKVSNWSVSLCCAAQRPTKGEKIMKNIVLIFLLLNSSVVSAQVLSENAEFELLYPVDYFFTFESDNNIENRFIRITRDTSLNISKSSARKCICLDLNDTVTDYDFCQLKYIEIHGTSEVYINLDNVPISRKTKCVLIDNLVLTDKEKLYGYLSRSKNLESIQVYHPYQGCIELNKISSKKLKALILNADTLDMMDFSFNRIKILIISADCYKNLDFNDLCSKKSFNILSLQGQLNFGISELYRIDTILDLQLSIDSAEDQRLDTIIAFPGFNKTITIAMDKFNWNTNNSGIFNKYFNQAFFEKGNVIYFYGDSLQHALADSFIVNFNQNSSIKLVGYKNYELSGNKESTWYSIERKSNN